MRNPGGLLRSQAVVQGVLLFLFMNVKCNYRSYNHGMSNAFEPDDRPDGNCGASLVEMQTDGRWTSPAMPGRYTRGQRAAHGAVARLRYEAGTPIPVLFRVPKKAEACRGACFSNPILH